MEAGLIAAVNHQDAIELFAIAYFIPEIHE